MDHLENEHKKYIEKVDSFIKEAEQIGSSIVSLANSIDIFSGKLNDLKQIKELDVSLSNLTTTISYLENCNKQLASAFADVDKFVNLEASIQTSRENFKNIEDKLKNILVSINQIDNSAENINLDNISNELAQVSHKINTLSDLIHYNIIDAIQNNFANSLQSLNNELKNLQNSFAEYKKSNEQLINELKTENDNIKIYFSELLSTNQSLIEMLKDIQKTNISAKKYMDTAITDWYESNITFMGIKKKKKDSDK